MPERNVGTGPDDFHVTPGVGNWAPDRVSQLVLTLGSRWGQVTPFVLTSGSQYRPSAPPLLAGGQYAVAYNEVKTLGGDPDHGTPTTRSPRQTFIGLFWGYDGTPALCAPPRHYNMVARAVALVGGIRNVTEMARYLAVINTVMAEAGISAWEAKWHYQFWRPVTGIRAGDSDGNSATSGVPTWYPLGAPATNTSGPNFTPPFPAYPSGHATFGGAIFETMRMFFPHLGKFTLVSDEWNGINKDMNGNVRPLRPETFNSLAEAEFDNAESRIYVGVHWSFDASSGIDAGHNVAHYVMAHAFRRLDDRGED